MAPAAPPVVYLAGLSREDYVAVQIAREMRRANMPVHRNRLQLEVDAVTGDFGIGYARRIARRVDLGLSIQRERLEYRYPLFRGTPPNDVFNDPPDAPEFSYLTEYIFPRVDALNLIPGATITMVRARWFYLDAVVRVTVRAEWLRETVGNPTAWFVIPQVALATTVRTRAGFYVSMLGGGGPTLLVAQVDGFDGVEWGRDHEPARGGFFEFQVGWAW